MAKENQKSDFDAGELAKTTEQHEKTISKFNTRITDLETRFTNLKRCYSTERYEEFQEAVEKIILKTLETNNGEEKIKKHVESYFKMKIVWVALFWLISIIATALIQKYFKILG